MRPDDAARPSRRTMLGTITSTTLAPLAACTSSRASDVLVHAAASTAPLLDALAPALTVPLRVNAGASATLARQIVGGARGDVVIVADPRWMDVLAENGRLVPGSRRDVLRNTLVFVVPRARPDAPPLTADADPDVLCPGRLALGDPDFVPAGAYGRAALETYGWWTRLAPRVIPAPDARAALRLVELGAVDAGILYGSDAAGSTAVRVLGTFDRDAHPAIVYPGAGLTGGRTAEGVAILDRLATDHALIERFGFLPAEAPS